MIRRNVLPSVEALALIAGGLAVQVVLHRNIVATVSFGYAHMYLGFFGRLVTWHYLLISFSSLALGVIVLSNLQRYGHALFIAVVGPLGILVTITTICLANEWMMHTDAGGTYNLYDAPIELAIMMNPIISGILFACQVLMVILTCFMSWKRQKYVAERSSAAHAG